MRGALHVAETLMNQAGRGSHEPDHGCAAFFLRGQKDFFQVGEMRDKWRGSHEVKMLFVHLIAMCVEFLQADAVGYAGERIVREHHGFRFHPQMPMLLKDIELMDPVSIGVSIGGSPRAGRGVEAE